MSQTDPPEGAAPLIRATLIRSSTVGAVITAGLLILTIVSAFIRLSLELRFLAPPAALLGIVSPVLGYRVYAAVGCRMPPDAGIEERCRRFFSATIIAMGITEGIALFGVVAFMLSGAPASLIGVLTHVILAAAIWPTPERLEHFMG